MDLSLSKLFLIIAYRYLHFHRKNRRGIHAGPVFQIYNWDVISSVQESPFLIQE